jgi:hypothetical protein
MAKILSSRRANFEVHSSDNESACGKDASGKDPDDVMHEVAGDVSWAQILFKGPCDN